MIAVALRASLAAHLLGFVAAAAPWQCWELPQDRLALSGQRGVITIAASIALPEPELPPVELPATELPVVVTPQQARIHERTYVATSTTGEMAASSAADHVDPAVEPTDLSRRVMAPAETLADPAPRPLPRSSTSTPPAVAGLEQGPDFAGNPPPEFPALAQQNGWYGTVLLKLWIDEEGRVTDVRVEKSSGYGVLDAAAVNAVKRWRGRPARYNARPVATEELLPVVFRPRLARDGR
ncbi:MAG TPA: energy transducer TonB [Pirellulaceae bacterium]|nr:energy transducer TonB [Pirellulaceae bacterium]